MRRATITNIQRNGNTDISIHALLAESDSCPLARPFHCHDFYPRSPCGERLSSWTFSTFTNRISIHALLAESDQVSAGAVAHGEGISIHALLAESDNNGVLLLFGQPISIHALLAESDASRRAISAQSGAFLSTLSLRRATKCLLKSALVRSISIHALLAESDLLLIVRERARVISIHALLAESDLTSVVSSAGTIDFYPRSPCGERRRARCARWPEHQISIHALLAESDAAGNKAGAESFKFLSTLSLRRATKILPACAYTSYISIHALLAESDLAMPDLGKRDIRFLSTLSLRRATSRAPPTVDPLAHFYPRSPCGERLLSLSNSITDNYISIHALLAESDVVCGCPWLDFGHFYPRSPCGERPPRLSRVVPTPIFLSTLSLRRATQLVRGVAGCVIISIHALLAESDWSGSGRWHPYSRFLSTLSLRRATRKPA